MQSSQKNEIALCLYITQILGRLTGCGAELCAYKSVTQSCNMAIKCRDHFKTATELDPSNHDAWFSFGAW